MHVGAIFYNLGVKNQDRKLKFGTSNVLIELYNIYSVFLEILKILDFISYFPKKYSFLNLSLLTYNGEVTKTT